MFRNLLSGKLLEEEKGRVGPNVEENGSVQSSKQLRRFLVHDGRTFMWCGPFIALGGPSHRIEFDSDAHRKDDVGPNAVGHRRNALAVVMPCEYSGSLTSIAT